MGNKIDTTKLKQNVTEISETVDVNENFLKTEFKNLFELLGENIKINIENQRAFSETLLESNDEAIINFSNNLITYLHTQITEDINMLKQSLDVMILVLEVIYSKHKNMREIFLYTINKVTNKYKDRSEFNNEEATSVIKASFPYNLLLFCIDLSTNDDFFQKTNYFKTEVEKFEISHQLSRIIYDIVYFQKINDLVAKVYIEHFDPFKIFLASNKIFSRFKVNKLIAKIFFNVFANFSNFVTSNFDPSISEADFESFIKTNFHLLLWFCFDINKFFFSDMQRTSNENVQFYFENEFNQKIFGFLTNFLFDIKENQDIIQVIDEYNKFYTDSLISIVTYNSHLFKDFVNMLFTNYDKLTLVFKTNAKLLLVYFFEMYPVTNTLKIGFLRDDLSPKGVFEKRSRPIAIE